MCFRAEKLALGNWSGKLMLLGVLLCVGGTMVVNLVKGKMLHIWPTNLLKSHTQAPANPTGPRHDMVVGTLWLCGSCLSYTIYFIVQVLAWELYFLWLPQCTVFVSHLRTDGMKHSGKACEGVPINILDDGADQPIGKLASLCGGCLSRP